MSQHPVILFDDSKRFTQDWREKSSNLRNIFSIPRRVYRYADKIPSYVGRLFRLHKLSKALYQAPRREYTTFIFGSIPRWTKKKTQKNSKLKTCCPRKSNNPYRQNRLGCPNFLRSKKRLQYCAFALIIMILTPK